MKLFIYLIFIFSVFDTRAESLKIRNFFFDCSRMVDCEKQKETFRSLEIEFDTVDQLNRVLKDISTSFVEDEINYRVEKVQDSYDLFIKFVPRPRLVNVSYELVEPVDLSKYALPELGQLYTKKLSEELSNGLKIYLESKGYTDAVVNVREEKVKNDIRLVLFINPGAIKRIKKVILLDTEGPTRLIKARFASYKRMPWDRATFERELEEISRGYEAEGFYLFHSEIKEVKPYKDTLVEPVVEANFGPRFGFNIKGNKSIFRKKIVTDLRELIKKVNGEIVGGQIEEIIKKQLEQVGVYGSAVKVSARFSNKDSIENRFYYIDIQEGHKVIISSLVLLGHKYWTDKNLKEFFIESGNELSSRMLLHKDDLKSFSERLKKRYIQHGYIFAKVREPELSYSTDKKFVDVFYRITEGEQSKWSGFDLKGVPLDVKELAIKNLKNKEGGNLNLVDLENDINKLESNLRELGYYFAKITNKTSKKVVKFSKDYSKASLYLNIDLGEKVVFYKPVLVGINVTKKIVILRKIKMKEGDIITPSKVNELKQRLNALGIFGSIVIAPLSRSANSKDHNLLITVREKKFRFLEVAPGFRTDIGLKMSTTGGWNNLYGLNHFAAFKGQVNQRLNYSSFDERRQAEKNSRLEYDFTFSYNWPYFLGYELDFAASTSMFRKRYRSYDADILRANSSFYKVFTDWLSSTIKLQIEKIEQFDATDLSDSGDFTVGSVTPGLTFDFRDNPINPRNGLYFNLSHETASPKLGSKDGDKDIYYNKIISRNAAYLSVSDNIVLAFSFSTGVQENLSDENKIPDIKVLRLTGVDRIRGFKDTEINKLNIPDLAYPDVEDVDDFKKAFFSAIKFEPRYYVSDTFVIAPFIDAGRVMVDSYKPFDLRVSTGMSFKYVTPVGTLNFDYGIKLNRLKYLSGEQEIEEDSGRFHISLGVF